MSDTVTASNGVQLPLSDCPNTINWVGGFVDTIVVVYQGTTYTQTFTNDGTNITSFSAWVAS
jgi:hypothetical protein